MIKSVHLGSKLYKSVKITDILDATDPIAWSTVCCIPMYEDKVLDEWDHYFIDEDGSISR